MQDLSSTSRSINASNIFEINRLGITDSFEAGKSLTLGLDYKLEDVNNNSLKSSSSNSKSKKTNIWNLN